jgi:DNA-binding transcriptional LysR family regulator
MELMQLEMLVAVAEEHSFLRAAERVFRTQPAVSIGIRKLEGLVGVPLLDRSSRTTGCLTPAGERLYEYARKILGLRDEALSIVKRLETDTESTLRVGLVDEESLNCFPIVWKRFKERYPGIELKLHFDRLERVIGELASGHLDVALVSGRPQCDLQSKNLVVTRLRHTSGQGSMWMVRQKMGGPPLAYTFQKNVVDSAPTCRGMRERESAKPRAVALRRLRVVR